MAVIYYFIIELRRDLTVGTETGPHSLVFPYCIMYSIVAPAYLDSTYTYHLAEWNYFGRIQY